MSGNQTWSLSATAGTMNIQHSSEMPSSQQSKSETNESGLLYIVYVWLWLDNGGITLNSEILKLKGIRREKKTLTILQVKKKEKRDHGEQYLKQIPRNTGY